MLCLLLNWKMDTKFWRQFLVKSVKTTFVFLVGDRVTVEMSPYDLTRGRITYRFK